MQINRTALGASLAVAFLVTACGSSSTARVTPAATPGASSSVAAATDQPASTDNGTGPTNQLQATGNGGPGTSLVPRSAPELEAMLPSTANGIAFTKTSFSGGTLPAGIPIGSAQLSKLLSDNGKSASDVSWAMAAPSDSALATMFVIAIQVKGVDGSKIADALGIAAGGDMQTVTVGGKQVQRAGAAGMGAVLYVKGDVAFYILDIGNASLTEAIVAALP